MTKEEFVNKIICEHWYCLGSWTKGKKWDDKKKQIWISGMHRAWNIMRPSEKIQPLEIVQKIASWTKKEAEEWYIDYISNKREKDDGCIESRWDILDL